jgi:polyvinyl alcohol dehydrogenase (cytochrome)
MKTNRTAARRLGSRACIAMLGIVAGSSWQSAGAATPQWPFWGGSVLNQSYASAETKINVGNVAKLKPLWIFKTEGGISSTPTIDGDALYVTDWHHSLSEYTQKAISLSRNSPAVSDSLLIFGDQASGSVLAIDKNSAALVWRTVLDTHRSAVMTSSPVIYNGRVYVGVSSLEEATIALHPNQGLSFRGSVAALDLSTGKVIWQSYTVPQGYTGGAVWGSTPVVDATRGSLYVTTGDNYSVPTDVGNCILATSDPAAQAACMAADNNVDAMVAYDLDTGAMKWNRRLQGVDIWQLLCVVPTPNPKASDRCPVNVDNYDLDFGSGANFIDSVVNGKHVQLIGAGQKSGVYWALNPDDGSIVWSTAAGPSGLEGGIEWGTATDNQKVYVAEANFLHQSFKLGPPSYAEWNGGSWAALDAATGQLLWQTAATKGRANRPSINTGGVTIANGVLFGGTLDGDFVALDAGTGKILWTYASGGSVVDSPSIVDGTVYWGSGYARAGHPNNELYAFQVQ